MILLDVNVLVRTFRQDVPGPDVSGWTHRVLVGAEPVGVADLVLSSFLRLVTNHRIFPEPAPPELAVAFCDKLLSAPAAVALAAGPRHWAVMRELVLGLGLRASDVPDAHLAALALERNATLATLDRGFARFPGLRLLDPTSGV